MMTATAFQYYYPEPFAHCYGCGRLNEGGYQIKSFWDGDESVCHFQPGPDQTSLPGYVYGGLLASLIDCHGTGTAAATAFRAEGRSMDTPPPLRFLTASLHVDYLKPTPLGPLLEVQGGDRRMDQCGGRDHRPGRSDRRSGPGAARDRFAGAWPWTLNLSCISAPPK